MSFKLNMENISLGEFYSNPSKITMHGNMTTMEAIFNTEATDFESADFYNNVKKQLWTFSAPILLSIGTTGNILSCK